MLRIDVANNALSQSLKLKNPDKAPRERRGSLIRVDRFDNSTLKPDHRSVGWIVRAQFGEDVLDSSLDGFLRDREARGNLFVGLAGGNQPEDIDFRRRQVLIGGMLGNFERGLGGKCLFSGMYGADGLQKVLIQQILQQVSAGASLHGA